MASVIFLGQAHTCVEPALLHRTCSAFTHPAVGATETRRTQRHLQVRPHSFQPFQSVAVYMNTAVPRKLCECPPIKILQSHSYWDQLIMVVFLASESGMTSESGTHNLKLQAHS